ncbi:MAG: MotA/TolQ/ExbB proton channel family protein [Armatimonadota bacterium]
MPFEHLFRDPVLIVLVAASIISWAIILDCILTLRRTVRDDINFEKGKSNPGSPLYHLHAKLQQFPDASQDSLLPVLDTEISIQRQKVERALPVLGVIGSTAPYMGLLGTVIGIIQAFQSIQAQNNMSPSIVAGGIATALIATAAGLAVAIPSVAAHHLITAAISRRVSRWETIAAGWFPKRGA